jgi:V/A-type H+-transporting ATPase subunit F
MKFFLLSDNNDTLVGMRLAGIEGAIAHDYFAAKKALLTAIEDKETAVLLITQKLEKLLGKLVYDLKLSRRQPLIVVIPDRDAETSISEQISEYIRSAIGLKL